MHAEIPPQPEIPKQVEKVEAFRTPDGTLHASHMAAVQHQLSQLLEDFATEGMLSPHHLAKSMCGQPLRSKVLKLLKELG